MKKYDMKKNLLLQIAFFFSFVLGYGQVTDYVFSETAGTYTQLTSPTVAIATGWDDNVTPNSISLGFSFNFNGIDYTTCSINSNGYVTFGSTISYPNAFSPISSSNIYSGSISALGIDIIDDNSRPISYSTTGTSPNRIFTVQWYQIRRFDRSGRFDFQIKLFETNNSISIVYGDCSPNGNNGNALNVQVGLRGATNADYNNRSLTTDSQLWDDNSIVGTSNDAFCRTRNSNYPTAGRTFSWTPKPIITSFTPNNACATSGASVVITGRNFTGATAVNFNSVASSFTVNSNTQITVQLPATATTGAITVTTGSGTATSTTSFTVNNVIAGNTINGNQSICSGSTPATLTGSTPTGGNGTYVYAWESSATSSTMGFSAASGTNSGQNYSPASLSSNTWYRRIVTSGGCTTTSAAIQISVSGIVLNNIISYNGALTVNAQANEGQNVIMTAPNGNVFTNVIFASYGTPNGTSPNFTIGACHQVTSQAKVEAVLLGVNSFSIPATNGFFVDPCGGTLKRLYILASYAVPICAGSTPAALTGSTPTGGNGTYLYGWESSTTSATTGFTPATGTNNIKDYSPSSLTQTTWFRRTVTSSCPANSTSSVVMITVIPAIASNTISSSQSVCSGSIPTAMTGSIPTGGNGTYIYAWESSTTSATAGFSAASGITNGQNYSPTALTTTTWYRRLIASGGCTSISTVVLITVNSAVTAGQIGSDQIICNSTAPSLLTSSIVGTGSGTLSYEWQTNASGSYVNVPSVNTATYQPPVLTATTNYRRRTVALSGGTTCYSGYTAAILIIVNGVPAITPNNVDETCPSSNDGSISPTLSGGLTNIRYIKLTQKYASWQQVAEIEAFEIFTGINVARSTNGATATSSSNYSSLYTAPMAIDGNNSGNNNFWHSNSPNINEWVRVDLQSAKNIDYLKIYNRTDCCQDRGQNMLLELFDSSNNLVYSRTIDLYQSGLNIPVNVNVLDLSWADGATTLNRTVLDSGTYTLNYADAVECSISSPIIIGATNTAPATPLVGTITQPDCIAVTGSVVLSGLPATGTWNLYQNGNATPIVSGGTGTTYTVSGLAVGNHTFTVSNGTCPSDASSSIGMIAPETATWNVVAGIGAWTNGPPTSAKALIFSGNYNSLTDAIIDTVVEGCSCKVNSGAAVVFTAGKTLKITNEVKVLGAGTLTFENNASLVQVNDAATVNTGNITVKRNSAPMKLYDYTYWSSPVQNWKLNQLSPNTGYYYGFDPLTNNWAGTNGGNQVMTAGKGYIIRAPQGWSTTNATLGVYNGNFIGVPNTGVVPVTIQKGAGTFNLIGNPYPSAIDIDLFLSDPANSSIINGTIYLWTHNTAISSIIPGNATYNYTSDDYAKYNLTGGIQTASAVAGGIEPDGKIASGQGFFIEANTALANGTYAASFKNSMRVAGSNNQFYKTNAVTQYATNTIEKNRIWLNISNPQGAYNETLLGYVTGATNGFDNLYDGKTFPAGNVLSFYSVAGTDNYSIQGRALPFNASEIIPLGYSSTLAGTFSIAIKNLDGFFIDQNVYLLDKSNNTTHNLKTSAYSFTTATGTFNNRFELRFTNTTLGNDTPTINENTVIVYSKDQQIKIQSQTESIEKVIVYDILGRQIYENKKVNSNELQISDLIRHQTLIVKIILSEGQTVTRKLVY